MPSEEILPLLKDYLEVAITDRNYLKETVGKIESTLNQTRECLTNITIQSAQMQRDSEAMKEACILRKNGCDKIHDDVEGRLRHIPSIEALQSRDEKISAISKKIDNYPSAKDLNKMISRVDKIFYFGVLAAGFLAALKWAWPLIQKSIEGA